MFSRGDYRETTENIRRSRSDNEIARLYLAASSALSGELDAARDHVTTLHEMNPGADIDWLAAAYPTRCYADSEIKEKFYEGLRLAGL